MENIKKIFLTLLATLIISIFMISCNEVPDIQDPDKPSDLDVIQNDVISIDISDIYLTVDDTYSINCEDTLGYYVTNDIVLVSFNNNTIDVTAISSGETTITFYLLSNNEVTKNVNVTVGETLYTIIYDLDGGSLTEVITPFADGSKVTLPIPIKEGYNFLGWYEDDIKVTELENRDYVIHCKWEKIIYVESLSFDCNDIYYCNDSISLSINTTPADAIADFIVTSSDESIASCEEMKVTFLKEGIVTLEIKDKITNKVYQKEITVKDKVDLDIFLKETYRVGNLALLKANVNNDEIIWSVSSNAVIEDNIIEFLSEGTVTLKATSLTDSDNFIEKEITVIEAERIILVADIETEIYTEYQGLLYENNKNAFLTLTEAIEKASENDKIIVINNIDYNVSINKSNIEILGKGAKIIPTDVDRNVEETIITSTITVEVDVKNIRIDGFTFTGNGKVIFNGGNEDIVYINNIIQNTTPSTMEWVETVNYTSGIITFINQSKYNNNIIIENNYFNNIKDVAINFSMMNNIKIINNTFNTFTYDCIRSTYGIPSINCQWLIKDNQFINGQYNGIMFRTYGTNAKTIEHIISIFDNYFYNCGQSEVLFSGAISFRNYQEGYTSVNISYNTFENCKNYILLRNNAVVANQGNFTGYICYNYFKGIPNEYYFKNVNNSDSTSTNPSQTILRYNCYEDDNGNNINLTNNSSKFIGCKENTEVYLDHNELQSVPHVYSRVVLYLDITGNLQADEEVVYESLTPTILSLNKDVITPISTGIGLIKATSSNGKVTFLEIIVNDEINIDYISRLLQIAYSEEGYVEGEDNDTKFGDWYGLPNGAWCAMFVSWCANQAGISTSIIPKYASVSTGMNWFINKGLFQYKEDYVPKTGDIIFFKSDGASHTGIVITSENGRVYTIEGNTSDKVAKRNYLLTYSKITGYGTPNYPSYNSENYVFDVTGSTDGSGEKTT